MASGCFRPVSKINFEVPNTNAHYSNSVKNIDAQPFPLSVSGKKIRLTSIQFDSYGFIAPQATGILLLYKTTT